VLKACFVLFLAAAEKFPRFLFVVFLNSPCETPKTKTKNAIKKTIAQNNRGGPEGPREGGGKRRGKKTIFFVMSPDGFFSENKYRFFFYFPCYETPKKRDKKVDKQIYKI
jgi:hypothetical protein